MLHYLSEEWGPMLYMKDSSGEDSLTADDLFKNIEEIAQDSDSNFVIARHPDVFSICGENKLIDKRVRKYLRKMLSALYLPEKHLTYEFAGNPLRKVLGYMFRAARKHGLLCQDCFTEEDHIILQDASRYMAGIQIQCYKGREVSHYARWGNSWNENSSKEEDRIFTQDVAKIVQDVLNYAGADSHTDEDEPYLIDEEAKELFFGNVMRVCYVLRWFGKYIKNHPDINENMKMQRTSKTQEERKPKSKKSKNSTNENKVEIVKHSDPSKVCGAIHSVIDRGRFMAAGSCRLSNDCKNMVKLGQKVRITKAVVNPSAQKDGTEFTSLKISIIPRRNDAYLPISKLYLS